MLDMRVSARHRTDVERPRDTASDKALMSSVTLGISYRGHLPAQEQQQRTFFDHGIPSLVSEVGPEEPHVCDPEEREQAATCNEQCAAGPQLWWSPRSLQCPDKPPIDGAGGRQR